MSEGTWILMAVLLGATAFGLWRSVRDGRFRASRGGTTGAATRGGATMAATMAEGATSVLEGLPADDLRGQRATLLQFSSAFCAPCRATRGVLADVASAVPGVAHVELDAEHHLDLVRRLRIARTPTTLLLDAQGREASRAAGAPRRDEVLATLARSGL